MRKNIKVKCLKIKPKDLDKNLIIVFLYPKNIIERDKRKAYTRFKVNNLKKYGKIPVKTKKYFKKTFDEYQRPFWFHLIPHILYRGNINIKNCEVIEV